MSATSEGYTAQPDTFDARLQLLRRLDGAKLSRFHWKTTVVAGMGFFTDSYDLFIIGTVLLLISHDPAMGTSSIFAPSLAENQALIGSSALIASFIGALFFGFLADRIGRKTIYGVELFILGVGALASALMPNLTLLIITRFILGIGIGGDYPVSATIVSEHANKKDRGKLISTVFAMQAAGIVIGYVAAIVILSFGVSPGIAWRLLLALGAVPALATFWLRRRVPETSRFLLEVRSDFSAAQAAASHSGPAEKQSASSPKDQPQPAPAPKERKSNALAMLFGSRRFLLLLLGTAGTWFLLDYAYYGNTISSPVVISRLLGSTASSLETTFVGFLIVVCAAIPGYMLAILTMDRLGRKPIQLLGFAMMALTFGAIALFPAVRSVIALFAVVFGISYFFTEFGPNTTTFIYPAEVFPTRARTTAHGIASGLAKLGGFVGVLLFPLLENMGGLALALGVAACTAILGFALTALLLPEPNQRSLEEMEPTSTQRVDSVA